MESGGGGGVDFCPRAFSPALAVFSVLSTLAIFPVFAVLAAFSSFSLMAFRFALTARAGFLTGGAGVTGASLPVPVRGSLAAILRSGFLAGKDGRAPLGLKAGLAARFVSAAMMAAAEPAAAALRAMALRAAGLLFAGRLLAGLVFALALLRLLIFPRLLRLLRLRRLYLLVFL
jgi:hypothetical protein